MVQEVGTNQRLHDGTGTEEGRRHTLENLEKKVKLRRQPQPQEAQEGVPEDLRSGRHRALLKAAEPERSLHTVVGKLVAVASYRRQRPLPPYPTTLRIKTTTRIIISSVTRSTFHVSYLCGTSLQA